MERVSSKKRLSSFKRKVFFRLFPIFILFILTFFVLVFFFALYHHYQDAEFLLRKVLKTRLPELSEIIKRNDKSAIKSIFKDLIDENLIAYIVLEKGHNVYYQYPDDNYFDLSSLNGKSFFVPKIRDRYGHSFYDFIFPVTDVHARLHVLIPCKLIDYHVFVTVLKLLCFGSLVVFFVCLAAFHFSCWAAQEVENLLYALQEREKRYRALWESYIDGILLVELNGKIVDCNNTACRILGYTKDELTSLALHNILSEEVSRKILDLVDSSSEDVGQIVLPMETQAKKRDSSFLPIELNLNLVDIDGRKMFLIYLHDISSRKQIEKEREELQEQLRLAQKLEALGTLAGGVAHDFNNLLTVINGYAELSLQQIKGDQKLYKNIELIKNAAERARQLTNQLLAFSRRQIYEPKLVNVNDVINNLEKMLRRLISEDIFIEKELSENLPKILADPAQIEQILVNLVVNARDAINELGSQAEDKIIKIKTDFVVLDKSYASKHVEAHPGKYVVISVSDTGIGMDEDTKERIFDPFFTTKKMGQGTGLGLATVYGIVKQNNAFIEVQSSPGQGSTFKIYWPAAENVDISEHKNNNSQIFKGTGKVILVEDDMLVREFVSNALVSLGYDVYSASCGEEALRLIMDKKLDADILITDLIMPGMNGKELAEKIRKILPNISILYISGYTNDDSLLKDILEKQENFIQKPFTLQELAQKLRQILD